MTKSADLLRLLRRIRRRARMLAALEGAVLGGAIGAGVIAGALAVARVLARGATSGSRVSAAAAGAIATALIGAAVAGARRISLERCARLADAALDRGDTPRDRVLSALAFLGDGVDGTLARAAIADAVSRARGLAPALATPARRPRQLPALVGAALALALVGAWPATAPGARHARPGLALRPIAGDPGLRVAPRALDAERAEARAAARAAEAGGDLRLSKLAAELHATLEALTNGQLPAGEALDRLSDVARRAREAGEEAEEARAALRAAGKALESTAETRGLARALGADEPDATERALSELAARTATGTAKTNENVARALDAAAAALGGAAGGEAAGGEQQPEEQQQRRLARDSRSATPTAEGDGARRATGERQLERLRRDLEDTAAACRTNPEACARRLQDRAKELQSLQREARGGEARRRVESAARQARERLRRGDLERPPGGEERRFQRAARGQPAGQPADNDGERAQRGGRAGGAQGQAEAEAIEAAGGDDPFAEAGGEGESSDSQESMDGMEPQSSGGQGSAESGAAAQGQGAGHEAGGEPLGAGGTPPTHGREREARVRDGAGPMRSEVIESAARRGFATRDYVRVFGDYQPVVEESLAAEAVPEGRRYVVRRYFQLIRPRAPRAP